MLPFLLQAAFFFGSVTTCFAALVLNAPLWLGSVLGFAVFVLGWLMFRVWKSCHPGRLLPWSEGLPQDHRLMDLLVPPFQIFLLMVVTTYLIFGGYPKEGLREGERRSETQPSGRLGE